MTPEQLKIQKVERLAFLIQSYDTWVPLHISKHVNGSMDGLLPSQYGLGLRLDHRALVAVVERHYASVSSFKAKYGFPENSRVNHYKVAGFTMYWLSRIRPIHDARSEAMSVWVNEEFAISVGIGMAKFDIGADTPKTRNFINHLRCGLQTADLTPEAMVLLLMALDARTEKQQESVVAAAQ